MPPLSTNTKLRVRRPDGIFPRASCQSTLYLGIGGKPRVIVGKNKMCLRYSMHRTSPVLETKTRQIGSDKSKRRTTEQYTQTLKVECVRMHLDMGGMVCGVDSAPQAFFPYLKATLDRKHTHTHSRTHTHTSKPADKQQPNKPTNKHRNTDTQTNRRTRKHPHTQSH